MSFDVNVWQAQALAKAFAETARNLVPAEVGPALILPDWMNGEQRNGGPLS